MLPAVRGEAHPTVMEGPSGLFVRGKPHAVAGRLGNRSPRLATVGGLVYFARIGRSHAHDPGILVNKIQVLRSGMVVVHLDRLNVPSGATILSYSQEQQLVRLAGIGCRIAN